MKHPKPLQSILVKPAGPDCNMACAYCYYLGKSSLFQNTKKHRMTDTMLQTMIRQVMKQSRESVTFTWQGGEPSLMGLPFYQNALTYQQHYNRGQSVGNGFQTNGLLLDRSWATFFKKSHFLVGLSLDGPQHIHDHYRTMKNGHGSWSLVSDRAKLLLDTGVDVNALVVLNDYSVRFPEEIYLYFKELGFQYLQFIPCFESSPGEKQADLPYSVAPQQYGHALCTLFDLWIQDFRAGQPTTSIRFFDSLFYTYVNLPPPDCSLLPECGTYIVIEYNGNVYSCDFFVEPDWYLGNISNTNVLDMLNSPQQQQFGRSKAHLSKNCRTCQWLIHCCGDCLHYRITTLEHEKQSSLCQGFKIFFAHAHEKLTALAEQWKRQREAQQYRELATVQPKRAHIKPARNKPCPCGSGIKYKRCCG